MPNLYRRAYLLLFLGLMLGFLLHAWHYYPFLSDDALISLRYADRLLDGKGLTWTEGRPVEGYSNLLWILLTALIGLSGLDLIAAARLLGLISMGGVIGAVSYWYLHRRRAQTNYLSVAAGIFFFCLAAPVAVWAIGGLEQPLYAAFVALSIPCTVQTIEAARPQKRTLLGLSLTLGLLCITRPDGLLFCAAAFLAIYVGRWSTRRRSLSFLDLLIFAAMPLLFVGGQLIFRLAYYGEWVPNTALVKIAPSLYHFMEGAKYVANGLWALFPFSLLAVVFIVASVFAPSRRSIGIPLLAISALWIPYTIFIGGDIFPAYRHLVPLVVVFTFAVVEGMNWALAKLRQPFPLWPKILLLLVLGLAGIVYVRIQLTDSANQRALSERWEWDGKVVGLLLKRAFAEQQPLLAVTAAGCLPYFSDLPALDMLGLNDYYLPRHPPADFGRGYLGHELGDGKYVLESKPDIITFNVGSPRPAYRSGKEMEQMPEFWERYTPIKVRGTDPHEYTATLWIYKQSPKIGIRQTATEIRVPGYLLDGNPDTVAYLNGAGKLVVPVSATQPVSLKLDATAGANWQVTVKTTGGEMPQVALQPQGSALVVSLSTVGASPIEVEEIVLTRAE